MNGVGRGGGFSFGGSTTRRVESFQVASDAGFSSYGLIYRINGGKRPRESLSYQKEVEISELQSDWSE